MGEAGSSRSKTAMNKGSGIFLIYIFGEEVKKGEGREICFPLLSVEKCEKYKGETSSTSCLSLSNTAADLNDPFLLGEKKRTLTQ